MTRQVAIAGSTGSIGTSTLDVVARHPERYRVHALSANTSVEALAEQCAAHRPARAVMRDADCATRLERVLRERGVDTVVESGEEALSAIAADEADVFAAYLPYHTWDARPVAGSAGLRPVGWHPANEAWGATQFQRRFERIAERRVRTLDFQVWLALRVIGEGVTRTASADPATVRDYVLSDDFELGIFKGTKVNFRPWNQQLRSPVLLANDRMIVSVSPQKEYLHQISQLDTLGYDEPESRCSLN